ncbi:toxin glutamine deamidase domain-containing protein [Streptomyces luteolus]|uniref:Toxin glutamine deamidase domain-containing protein n=1 Tax=Streptomyces luteolus TaxID=3043615 RepID=A0ABT6SYS9_9ACTN|nr:toxin glutamine deamidase domain-containing protein [Streptomyces sp. B-S-A12]MDI3420749.1 toxin glutamine deamidase domain-containing protein [Streptomyces sp. B-S-A12]
MLPDELEWVLEMLGFTWPTADEDKLVQSAEVWEKFAQDVTDLRANANTSASTVMSHNTGDSIDKFKKTYDKFDTGGDGYLQDAAQAATIIAFALRGAAMLVITCKIAVIVQLIALAIQIIAAAAASIVTFGLSNAASMAATAITRITVRQILDALKDALVEAIIECMKEPAVSALEAMVTDLTRQAVNVGFGAQSGIDVAATVKAGAEGGWEAIKQTPQTFMESVRDSLGSKAGGNIRNGAENYANNGPLGNNSSLPNGNPGSDSAAPDASNPTSDQSSSDSPTSDSTSESSTDSNGPSVSSTVSADIGNDGPSGPDLGDGPGSDSPSNSDRPSLGDFDDNSGSDNSPSSGSNPSSDSGPGASPGGNNSNPGGITSPNAQTAPTPSPSNTTPSGNDGRSIGTQVDSLAASAPTQTNSAPPPSTSDNSAPRGDGNHSMPTSPNSPSNNDSGPRNNPSNQGSTSSGGGTATSPNPSSSAPPRNNPSAPPGTSPGGPPPSSPSPSNPGPASTPRPNPGDGAGSTPGGRPSVPQQGGPVHVAPSPSTPHNSPGNSPGNTPGNPGTPNSPGQQSAPNTPPQTPANNPPQQQPTPVPVAVHTVTTTPAPTPQAAPDNTSQQPGANNNNDTTNNKDDDSKSEPTPASSTRDNTPPGGVNDPSRTEQNALENSVPRDENGDPTRPPNPNDGNWVERINGDGRDAPGRNNNCVDTALSTVDTYAGNPTAAGARTPDLDADGNPSDRGERGGRDRIENTLGARFNDMGNGRDAYNRLENTLRNSGHGSQAVIITQDANGRAHAWNAVNHNGKITYIDAQTGQRSPHPLHSGKNGVFAIPLDSDRRPVTPNTGGQSRSDTTRDSGRNGAETSGSTERRPAAEPAGQSKEPLQDTSNDDPDHPKNDPERKNHSRLPEREPDDAKHYGMEPMPDQAELRRTNDVRQVGMDHVHGQLNKWLNPRTDDEGNLITDENGNPRIPLVEAMEACRPPQGDGPNHEPNVLRHDDLSDLLPGFNDMHPGERGAVVASLARLSHNFHASHAVGASPEHTPGYESRGEQAHATAQWKAAHRDDADLKQAIKDEFGKSGIKGALSGSGLHRPDFTGRNYAAVEVYDPASKKISYMVDSSYPNPDGKHSEKNLLDYLNTVNEGRADGKKYEPLSMFSDREPCGKGSGYANCSNLLSTKLPGVDIFYGTGYRKEVDIAEEDKGDVPKEGHKKRFDKDLAKNLAALGKVWVRARSESASNSQ